MHCRKSPSSCPPELPLLQAGGQDATRSEHARLFQLLVSQMGLTRGRNVPLETLLESDELTGSGWKSSS